jgi:hypothetical protein
MLLVSGAYYTRLDSSQRAKFLWGSLQPAAGFQARLVYGVVACERSLCSVTA